MNRDPRQILVDTIAAAIAAGVPLGEGNVDTMRSEPLWDNEDLPLLLVDIISEQGQEDTAAPRYYRKTLNLLVYAYLRGSERQNKRRILEVTQQIETVMREWQSITESDIDPDCHPTGKEAYIIDEITAGDSITWFKSPNTGQPHAAVCLEYKALYQADGNASGEDIPGAPRRNILGDHRQVNATLRPLDSGKHEIGSETHL